jgi:transposase InsO family protein
MGRLEMVRGMPPISHTEQFCDTCVLAKHRRGVFPKQSKYRADKALELVHGDLCGPVKPVTPGGRCYFLLLINDATRYMRVVLLIAKSEASSVIKCIQAVAEKECGRKLRVLRTDNGGEFTAAEFTAYCADEGITRHFSAPYTPQQNGVVERQNQTVVAMTRALRKQRRMPAEFWGEAVVTAVYLQNRLPTKSLTGRTPYGAWYGRKPAVNHLRVFGCRVFVKQLGHVDKLADRSCARVFIGYTEGAKAYCILDPAARQVCTAREVMFDEAHGWDWTATTGVSPAAYFTVEYIYAGASGAAVVAIPASPHAPSSLTPSVRTLAAPPSTLVVMPSPQSGAASVAGPAALPPEFVTPLENDEERLDVTHGELHVRYRAYDNIIGAGENMTGLAARNLIEELNLMSTWEPCTFAEAEQDTAWQAAMQEEIDSVKRNQTW